MVRSVCAFWMIAMALTSAWGGEISFVEDYVLARDRARVLEQLIPGTEDYYYYHALDLLSTEQYAKAAELLTPWVQRHGETARVREIRTRHALLTYDRDPKAALGYLQRRLGLDFQHQREDLSEDPNFPIALDPAVIARERFVEQARQSSPESLDGYEDSALDWLTGVKLNPAQRRHLLARLARPDDTNLVKLIADDLRYENSGGFGSLPIHQNLLLTQLEELLKLRPDLLNQQPFVQTYLARLGPGDDEDWRHTPALLQAYLDRLWKFAQRLEPVHNSLRSHVLYHQLVLDRQLGKLNKERFLTYLRLPRRVPYAARKLLESEVMRRFPCDLGATYGGVTQLAPVGNDEPLVRSYLTQFLRDAADAKEFEPFINDAYLKPLLAEVKITAGLGNVEQWASLLRPERFQQLKERVDIDFAPTNPLQFGVDDPVVLQVAIKNVETLIIKIFEINTGSFYRENRREIDTDLNLDGLVANVEQTHTYKDPPLRRIDRRFEFPQLTRPGVYVVDFIGNGRSSRALIRKGRLRQVTRTGPAGQVFTVFDERRQQVKDASIWLAGREYTADEKGAITVPFSTSPGPQPIVISRGDFSCLDSFQHEGENYTLQAGLYVDRESLLTRQKAQLVIRPGLFLNGTPAAISLLEEPRLFVTSIDLDGVSTTQETRDFKLFDDRETVHEFQVPARTATLLFNLSAKVKSLTAGGEKQELSTSNAFAFNEMERTEKTEALFLVRNDKGYVLELLGKTGEPKISRPVTFSFKHRDFRQPIATTLKTDLHGRVALGPLTGIADVTATGPQGTSHTFSLQSDRHTYSQVLHGKVGDVLSVPYLPAALGAEISRDEVSLLELRGNIFVADRLNHCRVRDGLLVFEGLPAGDYDLWLKTVNARIRVRVTAGEKLQRYLLGSGRVLETRQLPPLQIAAVEADDMELRVRLANVSRYARVHLFADRFVPEYSVFNNLATVRPPEPYLFVPGSAETVYVTGRNIGDEYRYIIDRRNAVKYPGNLLERPSLLLNPWAVRDTQTGEQQAAGGDDFTRQGAPQPGTATRSDPAVSDTAPVSPAGNFANLDFLAQGSAVLLNLVPNPEGVVVIDRSDLGRHQHLHIVAVDPLHTTYRNLALPEQDVLILDQRLLAGLDSAGHFTQQKQITVVPAGQPFTMADVTSGKLEIYDSLARVYSLFMTLSEDPQLAEFQPILTWPGMTPAEKRTFYSKYASHELTFFIAKKDPEFFRTVIVPYLANKRDQTFLDRWLLEQNLNDFLQPWRFGQLNIVERILLAQRIDGERAATARHVNDLFSQLPPNTDQFIHLFDTAVKGRALEADDVEEEVLRAQQPSLGLQRYRILSRSGMLGGMGGGGGFGGQPVSGEPRSATGGLPGVPLSMDEARSPEVPHDAEATSKRGRLTDRLSRKRDGRSLRERLDETDAEEDLIQELFDEGGLATLDNYRALYRQPDPTREWAENNYHHLTIDQQNAGLITVNAFWRDYARHDPAQPFVSRNFAEASRNFPEMLLALAVLDLPFESPKHESRMEGTQLTLTAAGPLVAFHEEVRTAAAGDQPGRILVGQSYFRHGDRHTQVDGERVDKYVTDEFVIHTVYGCQVVITNPNSSRQKLSVLLQIPRGAIAVLNGRKTRTVQMTLEPYHTETLDYYFYFPAAGQFPHFPVHVARNEELAAFAAPVTLNVVDKPTRVDTESWDYVSQFGTTDQVIAFLNKENVAGLNLDRIAWRMQNRPFFEKVTRLLNERHVYSHTLWSYALLHNVVAEAREFLQHADGVVDECGGRLNSRLLTIDPVARRSYEHLEYKPLVNARAHGLGKRRQIVNDRFHQQYHRWLAQVAFERAPTDDDLLTATYYLLLQDRVEDALETFARVRSDRVNSKMQYDYCAAYLAFFSDEPARARAIAQGYANLPVDRWRNTFAAILTQLDEAEGKEGTIVDLLDRNQQQGQLAASEPSFEFQVEAQAITLNYQNLDQVRVNYYLMDVELLFSRNPFVQQFRGQFSAIRPNQTQVVSLRAGGQGAEVDRGEAVRPGSGSHMVALPDALKNRNILVEIIGGGQTRTQAYYSHSLAVQVIENYGQVRVTQATTGRPVPQAYVKVYAQTSEGQVKFYKDGYTDLRGRFDYASLSTNDLDAATKFSILILSDDFGATVKEATPPRR